MKKCLSFIITAMMFTAMTPLLSVTDEVNAAEVKTAYCEWVNPAYEDVIDVSDLAELDKISLHTEYGISAASDGEYLTTVEEAAKEMRDQLKARSDTVTIPYQSETDPGKSTDFVREIYYAAREHTGIPTEGDYLRYQIGGYKCSISYKTSNSLYLCTLTYTITYYTTAAQEAEMNEAVASLISDLDLKDKTDYQKIKSIYDYMCSNISYDYDNLEDDTYMLKYTAYAALINRTAVCQGYANLFYRLALEAGVDARLITGTGNGGGHAWNIANLGDSYYYLDSTWDAGRASYKYYLKGKTDFGDHQNGEEFSSDEFFARYMIPETGYEICSSHTFSTEWKTDADKHWHGCTNCGEKGSEAAHTFEWVTDKAATEEATGLKHEECTVCGYKQNENTEIPVLSHIHSMVRTEAASATCTEDGNIEYYTCSKCGKLYSDEAGNNEITKAETVDKTAGHKYSDWKTVKDATCTEAGTKTRECEVCGAEETAEIEAAGHKWSEEYTVDKAATCSEEGSKSIHCSVCDAVQEGSGKSIAKLDHTFSTEWKSDADKHWHGCTNCGEKGSEAAHTFEWVTDKAATEEATGLKHEECTVCGYKQNENTEIPVLSHIHSMVRTEAASATCTEDGNIEYYTCSKCGKLYSDEAGNNEITKAETVDKAAGHKYSDWETVKDPTCREAGTKTRECEVCGAEETAEIAATGHNWKDEYTVDKAATYAAAGTESIHCMTCDEVKEGTETAIPKLVCRLAGPSEASANLTSYYGSTAGYDDLKITWDKVEGADGYYVRYKAATSSTWKWASPTEKNYKYLKNLSDGIRYNIRVYPYVKENGVNYRSENYKPLTSVYTLKKVTVPTVSKMSSGYVKVKWKGISGETGYQIYRATSKNGKYTKVKSVTMSSSSYPYARIKTTKNKTYYYKVRAYKSLGSGKYVYGPFSSVKAYKLK